MKKEIRYAILGTSTIPRTANELVKEDNIILKPKDSGEIFVFDDDTKDIIVGTNYNITDGGCTVNETPYSVNELNENSLYPIVGFTKIFNDELQKLADVAVVNDKTESSYIINDTVITKQDVADQEQIPSDETPIKSELMYGRGSSNAGCSGYAIIGDSGVCVVKYTDYNGEDAFVGYSSIEQYEEEWQNEPLDLDKLVFVDKYAIKPKNGGAVFVFNTEDKKVYLGLNYNSNNDYGCTINGEYFSHEQLGDYGYRIVECVVDIYDVLQDPITSDRYVMSYTWRNAGSFDYEVYANRTNHSLEESYLSYDSVYDDRHAYIISDYEPVKEFVYGISEDFITQTAYRYTSSTNEVLVIDEWKWPRRYHSVEESELYWALESTMDPLCITAVTDSKFRIYRAANNNSDIKYSLEKYKNYNDVKFNPVSYKQDGYSQDFSLSAGESIYFVGTRGYNTSYPNATLKFTTSSNIDDMLLNVSGNINSLLKGGYLEGLDDISSYQSAFNGLFSANGRAVNIYDASELKLPSTRIGDHAYAQMFNASKTLVYPPKEIAATDFGVYACDLMFGNTKQLIKTPKVVAKSVSNYSFSQMFMNSESLESSDMIIEADVLPTRCCWLMFGDCPNLKNGITLKNKELGDYSCQEMYQNCVSLTDIPDLTAETYKLYCMEYFADGCTQLAKIPKFPVKEAGKYAFRFAFRKCESAQSMQDEINISTLLDSGAGMFISAFSSCKSLQNIPDITIKDIPGSCFNGTFKDCISATKIGKLNAESVATNGCMSMYYNCKNAVTFMDELPAVWLSDQCYSSMFGGCSKMVKAPKLPAVNVTPSCYSHMFYQCTNLTEPPELKASTLAKGCYQRMFGGCSSLQKAPKLDAITLADDCYAYMFESCSKLKDLPALPASILKARCYYAMFEYCTSIVSTPDLNFTTAPSECCNIMFLGCTNLKKTSDILLPESLGTSCYQSMFCDCINLENAPVLPARFATSSQYMGMFKNCAKINDVHCNLERFNNNAVKNWLDGTAATGILHRNQYATTWENGVNYPIGWTLEPDENPYMLQLFFDENKYDIETEVQNDYQRFLLYDQNGNLVKYDQCKKYSILKVYEWQMEISLSNESDFKFVKSSDGYLMLEIAPNAGFIYSDNEIVHWSYPDCMLCSFEIVDGYLDNENMFIVTDRENFKYYMNNNDMFIISSKPIIGFEQIEKTYMDNDDMFIQSTLEFGDEYIHNGKMFYEI